MLARLVRPWLVLGPYVRPRRRTLIVLGSLLLLVALLQVLNPQIVRYYIDRVTGGTLVPPLVHAAVAFLIVAVITQVIRVRAAYLGESVAWDITNALREDLTRHCVGLDYQFHKDHSPGELIERVDGDVSTISTFLSQSFFVIVSNVVLVIGILISLFITDWEIGCVLLAYTGCALAALFAVRELAAGAWDRVRTTTASMMGTIGEDLAGAEDIRTAGAQDYVLGRLDGLNEEMLGNQRTAMVRSNYMFTVMHGLYLLGYGGALALGAYLYSRHLTSLGTVYMVIAYANFIYMPLNDLRSELQDLQLGLAGVKRVASFLELRPAVTDGPGVTLPPGPLAVELREVSFRYGQDAPWALHDVSLRLEPGAVLALMGRTGSGKTSLARLIARMYDPTSGHVLVGGADLTSARADDLSGRIGVVTQDVHVFHGTVRDNVSLYDPSISQSQIQQAVERLGLSAWLAGLPDGIDTVLQSGQSSMSAGEAQLLAICRVFLRDPGLVILDEISSRLDAETERMLDQALAELFAGRTAVVIGHRVSTISRADQIVFLEQGRLAEQGERVSLLADGQSRLSTLLAAVEQDLAAGREPAPAAQAQQAEATEQEVLG